MVNVSKGLDRVLKGQRKISREIKLVRKLQGEQLVCQAAISAIYRLTLPSERNQESTDRYTKSKGGTEASRRPSSVHGSHAPAVYRGKPYIR